MPIEPTSLAPHQQRVVDEKNELDAKREKLSLFISLSPVVKTLDPLDLRLLINQERVMIEYSAILALRIERFT